MSDYLSQLVATNLHLTPVLQPRVSALFEPITPDAVDPLESESIVESRAHSEPARFSESEQGQISRRADQSHTREVVLINNASEQNQLAESDARNESRAPVEASRGTSIAPTEPVLTEPHARANDLKPATSNIVHPEIKRAMEFVPPASEVSTRAQPPIIRVTIGRIEVRAIQAPRTPAPAKTTEPPKLSLEEYLKSRKRGST